MNNFIKDNVNTIINDDNINVLKKMPDMSVSGIISDIPYALCDIDAIDMIKNNSNNSGDFMNKKWILPTVEMLKEFYRVLKTGGFMVMGFLNNFYCLTSKKYTYNILYINLLLKK
jgi:DNA modification methylase